MNIEIKKSKKPIKYRDALKFLESRLIDVNEKNKKELIWSLEHEEVYTAGTSYSENEILDKSIKLVKSNRGGKITYHGPGQLIFYFVINLKERKINIRNFITLIEKSIIDTLKIYQIESFADKKNIGIWYKENSNVKKVAAIGIRVSKWIAYHGFSVNINNNLKKYNSIVPCGIKDKGVTNLKKINNQDYTEFPNLIIDNFIANLNN